MNRARLAAVGFFVLMTVTLFGAGLFLIGERRMLFTKKIELETEFARVSGLQQGAPVNVSGMPAGNVRGIAVPDRPGGKFRVRFAIREDLEPLVRTDSVASIQTEGLVGGTYLAVSAGTEDAAAATPGTLLPSREPFEVADLLAQMSETVRLVNESITALSGDIQLAVRAVADTATHADSVIQEVGGDIAAIAASARRLAADTSAIAADLQAGRGTAGRLLKDDTLYREATEILTQARTTVTQVRGAVEDGRRTLANFNKEGGASQSVIADLGETVRHAREALSDLEQNMEALKRNWFFRGFFRQRGYFDLDALTPAEYRKGALERDGRRALRIWLAADRLFHTGPTRQLDLSEEGRLRIDSAMSTFLDYPLDRPLIIEGYAAAGTRADDFQLARQRAGLVRDYVIQRFALKTQTVGAMPLVGPAPDSPTRGAWEGVALALFVEPEDLDRAAKYSTAEAQPQPAAKQNVAGTTGSVETAAPVIPER